MRRILGILGIYTVLIFAGCVVLSFVLGGVPPLLPGAQGSYKFFRALEWFLALLPAVVLTGFMAGCTADWRVGANAAVSRFSQAMFTRFKRVLVVGLIVAAVLTLGNELFLPMVRSHRTAMEGAPDELSRNLFFARKYQLEGKSVLAWQYAVLAYQTDPKDELALRLLKETQDTLERSHAAADSQPDAVERISSPIRASEDGYTVRELLDKSDAAAAEEKWFDAHYWATLAIQACSGTDTNRSRAQDAANTAWNHLSDPGDFGNDDERAYFAKKKEGYAALNSGDNLKAYYIFMTLSRSSVEHAADPDVARYLAVSRERVESDFFFIDETADLRLQETARNSYFSLPYADGRTLVVCIRGMVTVAGTGGYIRYLDGFYVTEYDPNGVFLRSFSVPFAKAMPLPVSVLDEASRIRLGVQKGWKSVPYVQLQSVDRVTEGIVSRPEYSYEETGLPEQIAVAHGLRLSEASVPRTAEGGASEELSYILLPMDYADFDLLGEAAVGADSMPLLTLYRFIPKSGRYGFAKEVYNKSFVSRVTYPLMILILVVIAAVFAWNYRIVDEKSPFKFTWVLLFPLITAMLYVGLDAITYLFTILDYMIVGACGGAALFVAAAVYVAMLTAVSVVFLARHAN